MNTSHKGDLRKYVLAAFLATAGSRLTFTASTWFAFDLTGSAAFPSFVVVLGFIPGILLSFTSFELSERYGRRALLGSRLSVRPER